MAYEVDSTPRPARQQGPVTDALRAMRTEPEPPRRGFLRGLLTLPLIGGGVSLIGAPTAVAAPVTQPLMDRYVAWLAHEHRAALLEWGRMRRSLDDLAEATDWVQSAPLYWMPGDPTAISAVIAGKPSTRAALVLSTVGCKLPEASA